MDAKGLARTTNIPLNNINAKDKTAKKPTNANSATATAARNASQAATAATSTVETDTKNSSAEIHNPSERGLTGNNYQRRNRDEAEMTDEMISNAVDEANKALSGTSFRLSYAVHESTNMVMVKVYDSDTQEVIREIPAESRLDIFAKVLEMSGLILDKKG